MVNGGLGMAAAMSLWLSAYALCDYGGTRWGSEF